MTTTTGTAKGRRATGDPKLSPGTGAKEVVVSYKGFDQNFRCRGFQYEVGKTYEHNGDVEICASGFHACEHPLNIFDYYPPAGSRFAVVKQSGSLVRQSGDTKIASAKITIDAELKLPELIAAAVKWVFDRAKQEGESATGYRGAASATGTQGAAMACGYEGRASASNGNAIFLAERDDNYNIIAVWAGIAGRAGIKPDTYYMLEDDKPVEVTS